MKYRRAQALSVLENPTEAAFAVLVAAGKQPPGVLGVACEPRVDFAEPVYRDSTGQDGSQVVQAARNDGVVSVEGRRACPAAAVELGQELPDIVAVLPPLNAMVPCPVGKLAARQHAVLSLGVDVTSGLPEGRRPVVYLGRSL